MIFDLLIAHDFVTTFLRLLRLHIAQGLVRHGYPWAPPTKLTAVPDRWVRPTRKPADLAVGPTDLVGGPQDLPEDSIRPYPKRLTRLDVQDKASVDSNQADQGIWQTIVIN
jgi:hypothetical protein